MAEVDIKQTFLDTFGISSLGFGSIKGNIFILVFLCLLIAGIVGFLLYFWISKKYIYKFQIKCFSLLGNEPKLLFVDKGKEIRLGHIGDTLFFLKKLKRYIPPPIIQISPREFWFWKRSDGELINIGLENLDEKMKKLGCFFIHSDMRMQRLGIEKNLQFRLQEQSFWQKYGGLLINIGIFVIVAILMIVLFMEWRKTGLLLQQIADKVGNYLDKAAAISEKPIVPEGSGIIPALSFLNFWRRKNVIC